MKSILLKLKKILRYIHLYGVGRTLIKVKGKRHMNREEVKVREIPTKRKHKIGLVGAGNFAYTTIAYYASKSSYKIGAIFDIDDNRARSIAKDFNIPKICKNFEEMLDDKSIELIYIASNHATHATYAIEAIKKGKKVQCFKKLYEFGYDFRKILIKTLILKMVFVF